MNLSIAKPVEKFLLVMFLQAVATPLLKLILLRLDKTALLKYLLSWQLKEKLSLLIFSKFNCRNSHNLFTLF